MKILMITPLSAGIVQGGVRMQSLKTVKHLRELGHTVDLFNPWERYDLKQYDIVHLFVAGNETLNLARRLSDSDSKFVVSPVFFTRQSASAIRNLLKLESIGSQFLKGIFSEYSTKSLVCSSADLLLPNTEAEANLISSAFGIPIDKIRVVPNGVDLRFENTSPALFYETYNIREFTLFVGDASAGRKNLYPLLKQYTSDDPPLVIIGKLDNSSYSQSCHEIINANKNIHYLGPMDNESLLLGSAYAAAAVFTLPSHFETPGIAALEAGLAGCNIAITEAGGTREYFGDHAEYINPEIESSIIEAIRAAHKKPKTGHLKHNIKQAYSWAVVAKKTEEAYRTIL